MSFLGTCSNQVFFILVAVLPPLTNFQNNPFFSKKTIFYQKRANDSKFWELITSDAFYGKISTTSWLKKFAFIFVIFVIILPHTDTRSLSSGEFALKNAPPWVHAFPSILWIWAEKRRCQTKFPALSIKTIISLKIYWWSFPADVSWNCL